MTTTAEGLSANNPFGDSTVSATIVSLPNFINLPPVTFYPAIEAQMSVLPQIGGMTVWSAETLTLETWVQNSWGKHALYAATPNANDSLQYDALSSMWKPTPVNQPLLSTLKVYNDSTSILQVKRVYKSNALTGTSTGTMTPSGTHTLTGVTDANYRITIDSAGTQDAPNATFKWSSNGGTTYSAFVVPVMYGAAGRQVFAPIALDNGVTVTFGTGQFVSGDHWDFVAIAAGNQLYDLSVDTTNSIVQVGTILQIADANFTLQVTVGASKILFDSTDFINYARTENAWDFYVGGNLGVRVGDHFVRWHVTTTPATPPAGSALLYQKADKPYWLDSGGVESIIPQAAKTESITGVWSFMAAGTALSVTNNAQIGGTLSVIGAIFANGSVQANNIIDLAGTGVLGVAQIQLQTASPHIVLSGDVEFATASAKILASDASTQITVAAAGVTIPRLLGAVTASGAWTFSAASTAVTVNNSLSAGTVVVSSSLIFAHAFDAVFGTERITLATVSPHVTLTGNVKITANIGFFNTTPQAQQTSGANLTNSVTSGGTTDTIANYTDLVIYANDAAAIRNDIYQLARKLKQVNDALRTFGLLT